MIVPAPSLPAGQTPPPAGLRASGAAGAAASGFAGLLSAQQGRAPEGQAAQAAAPARATAAQPLDALQAELEAVAQDGLAQLAAAGGDAAAQADAITQMQAGLREAIAGFDAAHGTELAGALLPAGQETGPAPALIFAVPPGSAQAVAAVERAMGGADAGRVVAALTRISDLLDTAATAMGGAAGRAAPAPAHPSPVHDSAGAPPAPAGATAAAGPGMAAAALPFARAKAPDGPPAPLQAFAPGHERAGAPGASSERSAAPGQAAQAAPAAIAQAPAQAPLSFSALISEARLIGGETAVGGPDHPGGDLPGAEPGAAPARGVETAAPLKAPAAPPAPAPPPSGFSRALTAQIRETSIVEGRTRIALTPGGLGEIEIELSREAGQLKVVIRAENQTVLQALRGDRDGLMNLLAESGAAQDESQLSFESFERGEGRGREGAAPHARPRGAPGEEGTADTADPAATPDPSTAAAPEGDAAGDGQLDILT